ncbi:MAG: sigma-70 family RNA polymerase sigma factor, partial [Ruminococcus sp.]|nr:sigma-70 family RNA polymerase sigma factor [Ruminococcus sp.]
MNYDRTAEYVKRTLDGDSEAFSELYRMTYRRIYYICINFLKNRHDTDDAVQETYLSAYRNLDRLDEPSKFSVWLERTAVNKCMDFLRKKVPVPSEDIEEMIEEEKTVVLPEQCITDFENRRIVMDIMRENLSELQYQTVFMYYFNNFTVRETAEIMQCSEGAVKNRLSTARLKIKIGVEKYQDESGDKLWSGSVI